MAKRDLCNSGPGFLIGLVLLGTIAALSLVGTSVKGQCPNCLGLDDKGECHQRGGHPMCIHSCDYCESTGNVALIRRVWHIRLN